MSDSKSIEGLEIDSLNSGKIGASQEKGDPTLKPVEIKTEKAVSADIGKHLADKASEHSVKKERPKIVITWAEWGIILLLAGVQFTHILDFIIIMPLGPKFYESLKLTTGQFGILVGVYGIAASVSSLILSQVLDRFDRKKTLLFIYGGFILATLFCGLARDYPIWLAARMVAGAFGGVSGVVIMSIVGDLFADYRRATATGAVMSAFSVASIIGVPIGLSLAQLYGISAPFILLAVFSCLVLIAAWIYLPNIHSKGKSRNVSPIRHFWETLSEPNHIRAYIFSLTLVVGSFTLVPHIATYMKKNVGFSDFSIQLIYICGGICTLVSMNAIGYLSDRFGKLFLFRITACLTFIMCIVLTNLPPVSTLIGVVICCCFMVSTSGRMIPATAMMLSSTLPQNRGSFLGMNTALQHLGMGIAAWISGIILSEVDGKLTGYAITGWIAAICALLGVLYAGKLKPLELLAQSSESPALVPVPIPVNPDLKMAPFASELNELELKKHQADKDVVAML